MLATTPAGQLLLMDRDLTLQWAALEVGTTSTACQALGSGHFFSYISLFLVLTRVLRRSPTSC